MTQPNYQLPQKIPSYIRRLEIMYRGNGQAVLHEVVCNSIVAVQEGIAYDNWNGGTSGHLVQLFLTEETLGKIEDFDVQKKIAEQLQSDFNECCRAIPNEYIEGVSIELRDDNDLDCKRAFNPFTQPIINPESLDIWKPGHIRLFISHRDEHKKKASELAAALEGYGISSFVAHDTIEPMEKWQSVIQKAMLSAEIMLAFITDDFFDSCWTNQEIGFALGRGIPVVSLRMQKTAPRGFINEVQAMPANLETPEDAVEGLYKILAEKLGQEERLRRATLQAFLSSNDWDETARRFKRLKTLDTLTEADIQKIIDAFPKNEALYNCWHLTHPKSNRLLNFLENRTGKKYVIEDHHIKLDLSQEDTDIPF